MLSYFEKCVRSIAIASVLTVGSAWMPTAVADDGDETKTAALAVPEDLAGKGRVFHVQPSERPQVTFTSNTSAEKFKGVSAKLVGYVVSPNGDDVLPVEFVGGEFRLPVVSLDTGKPSMNDHMRAPRWFNADSYPEIVFKLSGVKNAKLIKKRDHSTLYRADLKGAMTILGNSVDLTVKSQIRIETTEDGDDGTMTIKCGFNVTLADFGMGIDDPGIKSGKIAKRMKIKVNLTLAPTPPSAP